MDTNVSAAPVKILRKWGEDYTAARPANMIAPLFLAPCFKARAFARNLKYSKSTQRC